MIIELVGTIEDTAIVARYSKKHEMDNSYMYIARSQTFIITWIIQVFIFLSKERHKVWQPAEIIS